MGSNPVWRITLALRPRLFESWGPDSTTTVTSVVHDSRMLHDHGDFLPDS